MANNYRETFPLLSHIDVGNALKTLINCMEEFCVGESMGDSGEDVFMNPLLRQVEDVAFELVRHVCTRSLRPSPARPANQDDEVGRP